MDRAGVVGGCRLEGNTSEVEMYNDSLSESDRLTERSQTVDSTGRSRADAVVVSLMTVRGFLKGFEVVPKHGPLISESAP